MDEEALCQVREDLALRTAQFVSNEGVRFEVVDPGHRRRNRGPDFHQAALRVGGELLEGDLEVHLRAQDWWSHGHATNPAYANVVLHVSLDRPLRAIRRPVGGQVLSLDLRPYLLAPARPPPPNGPLRPCRDPHWRLPAEAVQAVAARAGDRRFQERAAAFEHQIHMVGPAQALYAGVAEALGYCQNRAPFRKLAAALPYRVCVQLRASGANVLEAALLGTAGLLSPSTVAAPASGELSRLQECWRDLGRSALLDRSDWTRSGVRFWNFPARRVVALATLIGSRREGLSAAVLAAILLENRTGPDVRRTRVSVLEALFRLRAPRPFWVNHADFDRPSLRPARYLIGVERACQIAGNVALPWALALAESRGLCALGEQAWRLFRAMPSTTPNQVETEIAVRLFGPSPPRLDFRGQQGLMQLYRGGCAARRCETCPGVRRPEATDLRFGPSDV